MTTKIIIGLIVYVLIGFIFALICIGIDFCNYTSYYRGNPRDYIDSHLPDVTMIFSLGIVVWPFLIVLITLECIIKSISVSFLTLIAKIRKKDVYDKNKDI